jgi:spore coat protein A, manganese oxidase
MEIIIDFSNAVDDVIMKNNAPKPYPKGEDVDPNLDGLIMKFKITINPANIIDPNLSKYYQMGFIHPKLQDNITKVPYTLT